MNHRFGWNWFKADIKGNKGRFPGQKIMRSSMKRFRSKGWRAWVLRKERKVTDINTLTRFGEKAAPIAVPLSCWKKSR